MRRALSAGQSYARLRRVNPRASSPPASNAYVEGSGTALTAARLKRLPDVVIRPPPSSPLSRPTSVTTAKSDVPGNDCDADAAVSFNMLRMTVAVSEGNAVPLQVPGPDAENPPLRQPSRRTVAEPSPTSSTPL